MTEQERAMDEANRLRAELAEARKTQGLASLFQAGKDTERAKIVRWLRKDVCGRVVVRDIENGEHDRA